MAGFHKGLGEVLLARGVSQSAAGQTDSATPSTAAQDGRSSGLRSADLVRMRSVGAVALSPDATRVAYTVEYRDHPGRP